MVVEEVKEQFVIGRPVEGVYLNGIEYLYDGDEVRVFDDVSDAVNFLVNELGIDSKDDAQDYIYTKDFYDGKEC